MNKPRMMTFAAFVLASALCAPALAEDDHIKNAPKNTPGATPAPTSKTRSSSTPNDTMRTLTKLHETNQAEIEAGKLAKERGSSEDVREYGEMLVDEHQDADKDVKALAEERGMKLPDVQPADAENAASMQKLRALREASFDKAFLEMMVSDHEKVIGLVKRWRADTSDEKVREMLDDMLPKLEKHREQARKLLRGGER